MAIRKRIAEKTRPVKPQPKMKDIRLPADWADEELARYLDQGARVKEITHPGAFQSKMTPEQIDRYRSVVIEHDALVEAAKRLRRRKSSGTVAVVQSEGKTREPQESGASS